MAFISILFVLMIAVAIALVIGTASITAGTVLYNKKKIKNQGSFSEYLAI